MILLCSRNKLHMSSPTIYNRDREKKEFKAFSFFACLVLKGNENVIPFGAYVTLATCESYLPSNAIRLNCPQATIIHKRG